MWDERGVYVGKYVIILVLQRRQCIVAAVKLVGMYINGMFEARLAAHLSMLTIAQGAWFRC